MRSVDTRTAALGGMVLSGAVLGGATLALAGVRRGGAVGAALAAAGGGLAVAGIARRIDSATLAGVAPRDAAPTAIQANATILCDRERLFRFWRNATNMPKLFTFLERVEIEDDRHSVWMARLTGGGVVSWRSVITETHEFDRIAWRTADGAELPHRGSVHFLPAPGKRGTVVRLTLSHGLAGSRAARLLARLGGLEPKALTREALRRFKHLMEAGEIPTIAGQPHGERGLHEGGQR